MPWKSKAQERWGNSPSGHKALGDSGVDEWNGATKGKKLPERKSKKKPLEHRVKQGLSKAFPK